MWRTCPVARARCFEHTPRGECCQSRSNLDHRANARFERSAGGVNARRPCGTHGRSVAESVDAAEHRCTIHARWASDLRQPGKRDETGRVIAHARCHRSERPTAKRDGSRTRLSRAFCDQILSRLSVTLAFANHRTMSDTQPGRERPRDRRWGRVPAPEVGSLTSRLLSATLSAAAQTAAARRSSFRESRAANCRGVFSYPNGPRSASPHDPCDARPGTPPSRGDMVAPAPSPLHIPLIALSGASPKPRINGSSSTPGSAFLKRSGW